jgi:hypothetical protein
VALKILVAHVHHIFRLLPLAINGLRRAAIFRVSRRCKLSSAVRAAMLRHDIVVRKHRLSELTSRAVGRNCYRSSRSQAAALVAGIGPACGHRRLSKPDHALYGAQYVFESGDDRRRDTREILATDRGLRGGSARVDVSLGAC